MTTKNIIDQLDYFYEANDLAFDEEKHEYKLGGVTCAGISSVADYRPMPFLKFWAAKQVVEFLKDKQGAIAKCTPAEYEALLVEAKNQHAKRTKDALSIGERVHEWTDNHQRGTDLPITDDIRHPVEQYLEFEKKHNVQWLAGEKMVCSKTHLVAGRTDDIAIVNGKLSVIDKKTSNRIAESYFLQTAGYMMALLEMGIPIEQRIILRLPKTTDDKFQAALVTTPYENDIEAFLHLRYAREWDNYVSCKFKEKIKVGKYVEERLIIQEL